MTQDFKIVFTSMFEDFKEKIDIKSEHTGNNNRERETKGYMKIIELKSKIYKMKILLNGINYINSMQNM